MEAITQTEANTNEKKSVKSMKVNANESKR